MKKLFLLVSLSLALFTTTNAQSQKHKALEYAKQMPEPTFDMPKFLHTHLKYPKDAQSANIEGRVIVKFVVDEQGKVIDPVVVRKANPSLDKEALRVVSLLPRFTPAKDNGKNVAVYYHLPINFVLEKKG